MTVGIEEWTKDGRTVIAEVDEHGVVPVRVDLVHEALIALGGTKVEP